MAYARSNNNTKHGAPSMARRHTNSSDYSPPPNDRHNSKSYARSNSDDDPEALTNELVNDFKRVVQNKTRNGGQMNQSDVEAEVANIRCRANRNQCDINRWKRNLPHNLRNCPQDVLTVSMAYGNDPHEVESIIEIKMNETNSNGRIPGKSLENVIVPLKRLKQDLDRNKSPNLFNSIREIRNIDRANRLFLAEALHFLPYVKDYTYTNAEKAVKAIRETDCESDKPEVLLSIIKTLHETDDIREYLEKESRKGKSRSRSPSRHSSHSDDDETQASPPIINSAAPKKTNPDNDTSTFHIKPFENTNISQRFAHLPKDEPTQSFPGNRPPRK